MKTHITKKTALLISVLTFTIVSAFVFISCDNRKDFLGTSEKAAAVPPTINIRRFESGNQFINTFVDTFLVPPAGYRLEYQIIGIYDVSSVKITCTSDCDSVISTSLHADSSYFNIKVKRGTTTTFQVSVSNKFNETATAFFSLTFKNGRPVVNINKYGSSNPYGKTLIDTCDYGISPIYKIGYVYSDDNSTWTSLHCAKVSTTDASTITITNGEISVNYGSISTNNIYQYKIYGEDPLFSTSDTCYVTIVCYNKPPSVHIRTFTSSGPWFVALTDTFEIGPSNTTYSMGLQYSDDNSSYTSCHVVKQTLGDPGSLSVSNGVIVINYSGLSTYKTFKYKIFGTDPFGVTGDTCYATVVCYNKPPIVYIRPYASTASWLTTYTDTLEYSPTAMTYKMGLDYIDANSTYTSCHVIKQTLGDNSTITITSGLIAYNYSGLTTYKTFKYKIYGVDPYGATSDTCYATIVVTNLPPVIKIRPYSSSTPYSQTLYDTCHYPLPPLDAYNIGFTYVDANSTYSSMQIVKQTLGDPATITITSSSQISLNYGWYVSNNTFKYKIYSVDPLGATSDTCYATIVYYNHRPVLHINKTGFTSVISLVDTIKTSISSIYTLGAMLVDEAGTTLPNNLYVVKQTSGDNSIITKNANNVTFNYSGCTMNQNYSYMLYVRDPQGLISDSCYFTVYAFYNWKPQIGALSSATQSAATVNITCGQAPYFLNHGTNAISCPLSNWWQQIWSAPAVSECSSEPVSYLLNGVYQYNISFNGVYDPDLRFGGGISKIRVYLTYYGAVPYTLAGAPNYMYGPNKNNIWDNTPSISASNVYTFTYYSLYPKTNISTSGATLCSTGVPLNSSPYPFTPNETMSAIIAVYDNTGDSAVFNGNILY